jgi:hypothetical protein
MAADGIIVYCNAVLPIFGTVTFGAVGGCIIHGSGSAHANLSNWGTGAQGQSATLLVGSRNDTWPVLLQLPILSRQSGDRAP